MVHISKMVCADSVTGPMYEASIVPRSKLQTSRPRMTPLYKRCDVNMTHYVNEYDHVVEFNSYKI
jgi:hypothetical protein